MRSQYPSALRAALLRTFDVAQTSSSGGGSSSAGVPPAPVVVEVSVRSISEATKRRYAAATGADVAEQGPGLLLSGFLELVLTVLVAASAAAKARRTPGWRPCEQLDAHPSEAALEAAPRCAWGAVFENEGDGEAVARAWNLLHLRGDGLALCTQLMAARLRRQLGCRQSKRRLICCNSDKRWLS
eukprot:XP_001698055.1 predicted protein [Chlamydomonas reinhardtii]